MKMMADDRKMTAEEWKLWKRLEGGIDGMTCYRLRTVGAHRPMIYCPKAGLVIDSAEGMTERVESDLERLGLTVMRYSRHWMGADTEGLVREITLEAQALAAKRSGGVWDREASERWKARERHR